jgi:hypothetical protein
MEFIDPNEAICEQDKCKIIYDREPVYTDGGHLSIYGAELVTKYILSKV